VKSNTLHTFEFPFTVRLRIAFCGKVGRTATKLTKIENNSLPFLEFCAIVPQDDAIAFVSFLIVKSVGNAGRIARDGVAAAALRCLWAR
jgi:hypothetical protein